MVYRKKDPMKKRLFQLPIVIGLLAGTFGSTPVSATIYGVSWTGDFYAVDETDGSGTRIGPTGFLNLNAMVSDAAGKLYSYRGTLVTVDPLSGIGTAGPRVTPTLDFRGMAFSPDGTLFATDSGGGGRVPDDLYTIDVATGVATRIGSTGMPGVQGLAFDPAGKLYGWETGSGTGIGLGLIAIDPQTGAATDVNPAVGGRAFDVQTIEFAADGTLFGAVNQLFTIDVTTGALTPIGSGGYSDLRGVAFVPEPGAIALLAVGGMVLLWRRRRQNAAFRRSSPT